MSNKNKIIWTLKEFTEILRNRQLNKYDCNIGVSGKRGDGKSTFLFKVFNSFKKQGFSQARHQVYAQQHVIKLLSTQKFGYCWDDEAINSGYKRDFQNAGQKTLIKIVTNYRDNFNIYASALPFFYSLDKDLRELIFVHVHIIRRGIAVILLPLTDQIHSSDPWDTKFNIKIEEKESQRIKKNPLTPFRYHKFSTFAGYLYFGDMTEKQRRKYEQIKTEKRAENFVDVIKEKEKSFIEKVHELLVEKKLTREGLMQVCLTEGRKFTAVVEQLNKRLRDSGDPNTVIKYLRGEELIADNGQSRVDVVNLVPKVNL